MEQLQVQELSIDIEPRHRLALQEDEGSSMGFPSIALQTKHIPFKWPFVSGKMWENHGKRP